MCEERVLSHYTMEILNNFNNLEWMILINRTKKGKQIYDLKFY